MTTFAQAIRPHVSDELRLAADAAKGGDPSRAFTHLENAHVLGQASTREHARAHWAMLRWGFAQGDAGEVVGQIVRLVGALTKTWVGLVPVGNTGGTNVSPFRRLPIDRSLQRRIDRARAHAGGLAP